MATIGMSSDQMIADTYKKVKFIYWVLVIYLLILAYLVFLAHR